MRGWLSFQYPNPHSKLREEIILDYVEDERTYSLLQNRLLIETVVRANSNSTAKDLYKPILEVSRTMIGLKLPSMMPKDKIKTGNDSLDTDEMQEWKKILTELNKKKE